MEIHVEKQEEGDKYEFNNLVQKHTLDEDGINVLTEVVKDDIEVLSEDEVLAWITHFFVL
jgi:hypothetical protein